MNPEIKIRGYHTDLYQHVNNARYLEFLEEGRWQLIEDYVNFKDFISNGFQFFVVNINISYISQATVNDVIEIKSGLFKIGNKSAVFKQYIINKTTGKTAVEADVTFVIADATQKAIKIEGDLKEIIEQIPSIT